MPKQRKLKNYFINPGFQFRFIMLLVFPSFLLFCVYAFIFYTYTKENYFVFVELADITVEAKRQLDRELSEITAYLVVSSFVFLAIVFMLAIVLSHRIAGPLSKLAETMKNVAKEKAFLKVNFRPSDEFQSLATGFNEMVDSLETSKENKN